MFYSVVFYDMINFHKRHLKAIQIDNQSIMYEISFFLFINKQIHQNDEDDYNLSDLSSLASFGESATKAELLVNLRYTDLTGRLKVEIIQAANLKKSYMVIDPGKNVLFSAEKLNYFTESNTEVVQGRI